MLDIFHVVDVVRLARLGRASAHFSLVRVNKQCLTLRAALIEELSNTKSVPSSHNYFVVKSYVVDSHSSSNNLI